MGVTLTVWLFIIFIIVSYLLGSISAAIFLSKKIYGIDIHAYGSKNPGANNVQRVMGWHMGLVVFVIDLLKGTAACCLVYFLPLLKDAPNLFVCAQIVFGFAAVAGHIFPLYHHFRGGKGVSTFCGALLAIHPGAVLICTVIFLIVLYFTRYISISVIAAVTCFPLLVNLLFALWLDPQETWALRIFSMVCGVTIWLTHLSNLKRLYHGTEEKFRIRRPVHKI